MTKVDDSSPMEVKDVSYVVTTPSGKMKLHVIGTEVATGMGCSTR